MTSAIDKVSVTDSKLRLIVARALKAYTEVELFDFALDQDASLRTLAACEIQMRGTFACFDFAKNLATSQRYDDREVGAFILGQLGPPCYKYLNKSLLILGDLLRDPYHEVRATSVGALGFLASGTGHALGTVHKEMYALQLDEFPDVREALALTLGFIRTPEANSVLNTLLNDSFAEVRAAAEFGLDLHTNKDE